jgi:hypothetical protein
MKRKSWVLFFDSKSRGSFLEIQTMIRCWMQDGGNHVHIDLIWVVKLTNIGSNLVWVCVLTICLSMPFFPQINCRNTAVNWRERLAITGKRLLTPQAIVHCHKTIVLCRTCLRNRIQFLYPYFFRKCANLHCIKTSGFNGDFAVEWNLCNWIAFLIHLSHCHRCDHNTPERSCRNDSTPT